MRDESGEWAHAYEAEVRLGATAPQGPYAWYLTDARGMWRFLVLDFDASRGDAGDVARDLAGAREVLAAADVEHLVCRSGPAGGMHVWVSADLVSADLVRAVAVAAARRWPTLDLSPLTNRRTGCVRPPGAPHRAGGWSRPEGGAERAAAILSRPVEAEAIQRLAVLLDADLAVAEAAEAAVRAVEQGQDGPRLAGRRRPCDVADLLAVEVAAGQGHAHLARVLVRLALARWSRAEAVALVEAHLSAPGLVHVRRQGGARERVRGVGERAALLERQWARAVAYAATLRREVDGQEPEEGEWPRRVAGVVATVAGVRRAVEGAAAEGRWARQSGPADRRALEFALEMALEAVAGEVELDCRRVALACGMGKTTAARALRRLCLDGWLALVEAGEGRRAHRYRVLQQPDCPAAAELATSPPDDAQAQAVTRDALGGGGTQAIPRPAEAPSLPCAPDVARTRHRAELAARREITGHDLYTHPRPGQPGLGAHTAATAAALATGLYNVKDLAQATGYTAATTRRHLTGLRTHNLARPTTTAATTWRPTATSPDRVTRRIGAAGVRARRARAYALDRAIWAWWLDELAWMRTPGKRRGRAAGPGQQPLILVGAPTWSRRARYPRDDRGRADHHAARTQIDQPTAAERRTAGG
ncbi:hypothetical protein SAMN05421505_15520 [Sinosporangium album]|uniref:Uncharacterized protein n=1 Tax=Sinosporangium album TaxID=504805 RepID=A0A1G8KUU5_9ACTN|nr:hypothetical protein SAMN05421505_15520 [Sinosporangium album]